MPQFFTFDQNCIGGEREIDALRAFTPLRDVDAVRDSFSELLNALFESGILTAEQAVTIAGSGARVRQ